MFQYRQVLVRLRQGDSDRDIARSRLMGRPKVAVFRVLAGAQGWLSPGAPLPEDAAIGALIAAPRRALSTISTVELRISRKEGHRFTARRSMVSRDVGPLFVTQDMLDFR